MKELRNEVLNMIVENNGVCAPTYEQLTYLKNKFGKTTTQITNTFDYFRYGAGRKRLEKAVA